MNSELYYFPIRVKIKILPVFFPAIVAIYSIDLHLCIYYETRHDCLICFSLSGPKSFFISNPTAGKWGLSSYETNEENKRHS